MIGEAFPEPDSVPPSEKVNRLAHGASAPGSVKNVEIVLVMKASGPAYVFVAVTLVMVGLTLFTVTLPVYSFTPPSLSLIFPLTDLDPLSLVGQLRLLAVPKEP